MISIIDHMYFRLQYSHGHVTAIDELKSYEVQFEDGTMCSELSSNDIIVSYSNSNR